MEIERVYQATLQFLNKEISLTELDHIYESYMQLSREKRWKNAGKLLKKFAEILNMSEGSMLYYYFASFLLYASESARLCNDIRRKCLEDEQVSIRTKFLIYSYLERLGFLGVISGHNTESSELSDQLYEHILFEYKKEISGQYEHIPIEQRNSDLIFLMTTQFLSLLHGPTKTTLDRAEVLKKDLGKDVFIINTAELLPYQEKIFLFRTIQGNYIEGYNQLDFYTYHDIQYPFFQCPREMPSASIIREIMEVVACEKPLCIVTIGGNSILSDLCSMLVPTIVISTVPSGRSKTYGQFQAIGRKVSQEDLEWAKRNHLSQEHFIESVFTSSFKEQKHHYGRKDLKLPEDAFIAALVGVRLDDEIDEICLQMLENLMKQKIYIAFLGNFKRYESLKENRLFAEYGIDMGMQEDILGVLECIDLYINPKRTGGGTSVAEALYKGVPVVTMDYGDGGLGAGEDFFVQDYDEMFETVLRYRSDPEFYSKMSSKAGKRAEVLTNSSREFVKIMETAMSRKDFQ